jgi:hypothetical protein
MDNHDRNRDDDRIDLENPLGIAGEPIARDPSDIHASNDEESVRRRRARAGLGHQVEERHSSGLGDLLADESDGATGIDMGYGGDGTNVKP